MRHLDAFNFSDCETMFIFFLIDIHNGEQIIQKNMIGGTVMRVRSGSNLASLFD